MTDRPLAFFTPGAWPADEADRQAQVDRIDYAAAAADPRLAEIVARTAELFGSGSAVLSIVDRDRQNWIVRSGVEETGTARAISFCGHAVAAPDKVLTVLDATKDARFAGNPLVAIGNQRFYIGAPVMAEGMALGVLCSADTTTRSTVDPVAHAELTALAAEASTLLSRYLKQARAEDA